MVGESLCSITIWVPRDTAHCPLVVHLQCSTDGTTLVPVAPITQMIDILPVEGFSRQLAFCFLPQSKYTN